MLPSVVSSGVIRQSAPSFLHKSLTVSWHTRCRSGMQFSRRTPLQSTPIRLQTNSAWSRLPTTARKTHLITQPQHRTPISSPRSFSTSSNTAPQSLQQQLTTLQSDIQKLSYLIHQSQSSTNQTQSLARRAEARAYIIEQKLEDIQRHVVKIPSSLKALEGLAHNVEVKMRNVLPQTMQDRIDDGKKLLSNKYTLWGMVGAAILFYQYRTNMYQRTSEEVANVAAMTLQQDSLRRTIQETLTTVANSPETLESLSLLFQRLIREEKTEQHLIDLIVRALNSEGVKLAAIHLLELCFQNEELQRRGGEFLKIAANSVVLDEVVQRNAGVGIQKALKSVVTLNVPWGRNKGKDGDSDNDPDESGETADENDGSELIDPSELHVAQDIR